MQHKEASSQIKREFIVQFSVPRAIEAVWQSLYNFSILGRSILDVNSTSLSLLGSFNETLVLIKEETRAGMYLQWWNCGERRVAVTLLQRKITLIFIITYYCYHLLLHFFFSFQFFPFLVKFSHVLFSELLQLSPTHSFFTSSSLLFFFIFVRERSTGNHHFLLLWNLLFYFRRRFIHSRSSFLFYFLFSSIICFLELIN